MKKSKSSVSLIYDTNNIYCIFMCIKVNNLLTGSKESFEKKITVIVNFPHQLQQWSLTPNHQMTSDHTNVRFDHIAVVGIMSVALELSGVSLLLSLSEEESKPIWTVMKQYFFSLHCEAVIAKLSAASLCSTNDCQLEKERKKESLFETSLIFSAIQWGAPSANPQCRRCPHYVLLSVCVCIYVSSSVGIYCTTDPLWLTV